MYKVNDVECLEEVASQLLNLLRDQRLWLFTGTMGSGKTSLIRALCRKLSIEEPISSPTFTLLHSYTTSEVYVHHADLYRLQTTDELHEIGIDDCMYGPDYCFVEWADRFPEYWPLPQSWVYICHEADNTRRISLHSLCPQRLDVSHFNASEV